MQSGEQERSAPQRVLVIMSVQAGAEQLAAAVRELGASTCEIAQDRETALSRCAALQPELVFLDAQRADSLQLAAAVRELTPAPFVYVCDAQAEPQRELVALCASYVERPLTAARLRRCLTFSAYAGKPPASFGGELLESVAQELRAPLQGVSGFAQYLLDGKAGPLADAQITCLQQVELGTQHALQLLQDALALTHPGRELSSRELRSEVVETEQTLREVVQLLQPLALARDLELDLHIDERLQQVTSDASKLKQVLFDLVANAIQHAPGSGKLWISLVRMSADVFRIEVRDAGPGLPQPTLAQVNAASTAESSGHGLARTKRIVAALGGRLHAFNDKPSGAVFRVELPVHPSAARPFLHST